MRMTYKNIGLQRICLMLVAFVTSIVGCSSLTPAEKAERIRQVKAALDDRRYTIDVKEMYPMRGPSRNIARDWSIEVRGDTLVSYLPYIGRAFSAPFGQPKGLNFTALISKYHDQPAPKGLRIITMTADSGEDVINYRLEVFDNGQASIDVQPRNLEGIAFSGEISWPE